MSRTAEQFQDALLEMIDEEGMNFALSIVTGTFVGLTLQALREQGHEPEGEVLINGGDSRDVTIHAAKKRGLPH